MAIPAIVMWSMVLLTAAVPGPEGSWGGVRRSCDATVGRALRRAVSVPARELITVWLEAGLPLDGFDDHPPVQFDVLGIAMEELPKRSSSAAITPSASPPRTRCTPERGPGGVVG